VPRRRLIALALVSTTLTLVACGDDSGDAAAPGSSAPATEAPTTTRAVTTTAAPEPLEILVTDGDGIAGAGLDVLVQALQTLPDVEVTIVAPATDQSGTSDSTTDGVVAYADATTVSGIPGTAVEGYPADTIAVALDELDLDPDLVVSGINRGQNIGPFVPVSGTVGAARTAVRRGIPAVAVSAGNDNDTADYDGAAELVLDWIGDHREQLLAGTAPAHAVVNFNVPTCTAGRPRALLEVPVAAAIPAGVDVFNSDCSMVPVTAPADDVTAIAAGHPTVSEVPPDL
jgi:5'-nucleotidase